jgi:hypothetical protein
MQVLAPNRTRGECRYQVATILAQGDSNFASADLFRLVLNLGGNDGQLRGHGLPGRRASNAHNQFRIHKKLSIGSIEYRRFRHCLRHEKAIERVSMMMRQRAGL